MKTNILIVYFASVLAVSALPTGEKGMSFFVSEARPIDTLEDTVRKAAKDYATKHTDALPEWTDDMSKYRDQSCDFYTSCP